MRAMRAMRAMRKMRKMRRAFTLVEVLIVIAIIGLLAAIAIPSFQRAKENARRKELGLPPLQPGEPISSTVVTSDVSTRFKWVEYHSDSHVLYVIQDTLTGQEYLASYGYSFTPMPKLPNRLETP
jgi:prepilin-type N-terminal cleavage/methylation domain-containing protein